MSTRATRSTTRSITTTSTTLLSTFPQTKNGKRKLETSYINDGTKQVMTKKKSEQQQSEMQIETQIETNTEITTLAPSKSKKSKSSSSNTKSSHTTESPYTQVGTSTDGKVRCWNGTTNGMLNYHDHTWGRIGYHANSDNRYELFACMCFQMFQSGLSWSIILNKMPSMKIAFKNFNYHTLATFTSTDINRLLENPGIIRNRKKIESLIHNAKLAVQLDKTHPGGFPAFIFHEPVQYAEERNIPLEHASLQSHMRTDMKTPAMERLYSDGVHPSTSVQALVDRLKDYGFQFLGPTTMLSFMQACGIVNHHKSHCFAYPEIESEYATWHNEWQARSQTPSTSTSTSRPSKTTNSSSRRKRK